ncbi:hypothetical protein IJI31_04755 [bacterium]|nr:hypothetical protein [bacterium]
MSDYNEFYTLLDKKKTQILKNYNKHKDVHKTVNDILKKAGKEFLFSYVMFLCSHECLKDLSKMKDINDIEEINNLKNSFEKICYFSDNILLEFEKLIF